MLNNIYNNNKNNINKKKILIAILFIFFIFYYILQTESSPSYYIKASTKSNSKKASSKDSWSDSQLTRNIKYNMMLKNATIDQDLYKVKWHDEIRPFSDRVRKFKMNNNGEYVVNIDKIYDHPDIAIISSNRPKHLNRLLHNLIDNCNANIHKIYVFDDGSLDVSSIIKEHNITNYHRLSKYVNTVPKQASDGKVAAKTNEEKQYYMNSHYKEVFSFVFNNKTLDKVIFLEDDLIMAPDSLQYFKHLSKLMDYDPSIFSISAWNDNGFKWNVDNLQSSIDNKFSFRRQEHFGGLGFLTSQKVYKRKIEPKWKTETSLPWDVVIQSAFGKSDSSIYPEIPRSHHAPILERDYNSLFNDLQVGDGWANYNFYLPKNVLVHTWYIDISKYLSFEYDSELKEKIHRSIELDSLLSIPMLFSTTNSFLMYLGSKSNEDPKWDNIISKLQMIGRGNGGAVRGIYKGVIETTFQGRKLFIVGTYSPFYDKNHRKRNPKIFFSDFKVDQFDSTVESAKANTYLYRMEKDLTLEITLAESGFSCKDFCEKHKRVCQETDMMILTDPTIVQIEMETHCATVKAVDQKDQNIYYPIKDKDRNCFITKEFSKLSCTSKLPKSKNDSSRICICKDKQVY
ncbi:hypothetical protein DICPUDRAFT_91685 [Dictyostelium purpureum]|uniref:alpha-1,3-mannosyl-glycoprotein 2-beta-N-acetylglucosaminyltransferase n=1 Tax=Dictyostelium purpureum TaxID=5786 RepID=F0ZFV2_DICPU|nr:uncharacterized protein DICPUDRAFT_91685 [Dictyostelium purpureum]EGC37158.1 hypothetical protein DICPUDRAFT_91685 [Dictyostelium purpureum]|eukprot:XP_003286286.1 hypothetical protein DICPUDRAFT_91685 [Dictyostelium purpureum]